MVNGLACLGNAAVHHPGGPVTTRMRCCICGDDTEGADYYVMIGVITEQSSGEIQYLGAHAAHLEATMARGFIVEVTLM